MLFVYFRTEMELDVRIVLDLSIKEPFTLSEIHEMAVFVGHHIGALEACEIIKFFLVVRSDPAGFIKRQAIELH